MISYIKRGIDFIKKNPGILYSFLLIILIPLALYYNGFFAINSFQKNIDYELQTKALMAENIFSIIASSNFENSDILEEKIKKIAKENQEIVKIQVFLPEKERFKIIGSKNSQEIGKEASSTLLTLAWSKDQAIAHLTAEKRERFWNMTRPFYNLEGEKAGLISVSLSLKSADFLVLKIVRNSYLILFVSILLSLFLIIHHTYLFKYSILLRKLREVDKMKDSFIRMATHELQSPIVNIRNYIYELEEKTRNSLTEEQKGMVKIAKISARNLVNLVQDILEVSRIEQGRLDFTAKVISPSELIEETVEGLKGKAQQKNLTLNSKVSKSDYFIKVNSNRFRQILVNLIENAIKYTFEGKITVTASIDEKKKRYVVEVKDTGIGISAEDRERLFEKFYRVKTEKTSGVPGTGLGLWISKQLCERMKGQIFIESMEEVGTKFTVIFPLAKG